MAASVHPFPDDEPQRGDVVPYLPQTNLPDINPMNGELSVWASFDFTTPRGAELMCACIDGECVRLANLIGSQIGVEDLLVHWCNTEDEETGEIRQLRRIVLICDDAMPVACCSSGIWRSIGVLCRTFGPPPWNPPLPLMVKQREIGNNRRMFYLSPVKSAYARLAK